tara:strand:+ start:40374 stop:40517 length:144 start_codon:yes stop_codon:yes gene_type:complete
MIKNAKNITKARERQIIGTARVHPTEHMPLGLPVCINHNGIKAIVKS